MNVAGLSTDDVKNFHLHCAGNDAAATSIPFFKLYQEELVAMD
jgi:hypothetical protein